jgi:hypothetical protein
MAVVCLLAGCSDDQPAVRQFESPQVATLRSEGLKASAPTDADDQRPLVPFDATDEEIEAFRKVWADCVRKEGGPGYEDRRAAWGKGERDKAVRAACLAKEPESFEERQLRTDVAAYEDNQRQWYQCAQKAGYKLTPPQEHGEFGITEVGPNGDFASPRMEACRKDAFRD